MSLDPEEDVRADITAAFAAANEAAPEPAAEEVKPVAEIPDPKAETEEQKAERVRDEQGRFAKADEAQQAATVQPTQAAEPQTETIRPPASWSPTAKADFAKLAPHIQQEVLKREKDIESGKAQWETKAEQFNRFDALVAPHRERLQLAQTDEFRYIQGLITADEMLRGPNRLQALQQIAAMYGIPLGQEAGAPQQTQAQQAFPTPQLSVEDIQREARAAAQAQWEAQQEESLKHEAQSAWQAFRSDPKHPYAENVKEAMAALLTSGAAADYTGAYEMATWATPEIRALLIAEQAKSQETPRDVRPVGLSVVGGRGLGQAAQAPGNPNSSVDDDVRDAYRAVTGRI